MAIMMDKSTNIIVIPHKNSEHPHNHLSSDYIHASKGYIDEFIHFGRIL